MQFKPIKRMVHVDLKRLTASVISRERGFFPSRLPRSLKEFYLSNSILNFGLSAGLLFEPIYLYTLGFSLTHIMLFYFCVYAVYFFMMPVGGNIAKRKGFEHGMMYGSFFTIFYLMCLISIPAQSFFLVLAVCALGIQKALFWPAYHADFAFFSQSGERGRDVSTFALLDSLVTVLGPVVGGAIIYFFGFPALFVFISLVVLLSGIPMMMTREIFTPTFFPYADAYAQLSDPKNRKFLLGYMGFGEELLAMTVWPIFIYLTFSNVMTTGSAVAFSTFATALVIVYVGRWTDTKNRVSALRVGIVSIGVVWIARLLARGVGGILFIDFCSRLSRSMFLVPLLSGTYEHANKTSIMKTVVFMEMGVALGKMCAALILAVAFSLAPTLQWSMAFGVGLLFTLLYGFLTTRSVSSARLTVS